MKTAPSGVTSNSMGSVGDNNGYCIRGCTKIKRLCMISFSIVSLIGVFTLYAQHFDKRVHIEQFRLLDLSSFRGVAKGPVNFGELSNSSITARLRNTTVEPENERQSQTMDEVSPKQNVVEVSPKQNVVEVSPKQNVVEVSPKQNVTQNSMSNPADEEGIITSDEKAAIKSMNTINKSESVPVYWVNLNKSKTRRKYFSEQLENLGMWNQRIRAVTPEDDVVKGATLAVLPAVQHTSVELSCVVSHLIAMHTAIYDEMSKDNQYALITEDDVSFEMDVDFFTLAELAPKDFGALQLMTSSSLVVKNYWNKYKEELSIHKTNTSTKHGIIAAFPDELIWKRRKVDSQYWSTQAYLINKKIAKTFIDRVVSYNSTTSLYSIKIANPSEKLFPCSKPDRCFLPYRIVGDTYLYSGLDPTYLCRIPIFNGASVGENSTIHAKKSKNTAHMKSFSEIAVVLDDVRENPLFLPSYIRIKNNTNTNTNMNFIPSAL